MGPREIDPNAKGGDGPVAEVGPAGEDVYTEEHFLKTVPRPTNTGKDRKPEIDPRSGFLLSWVDGKKTLSEILAIAGMGRREAIQRIRDMFQLGLVDFGGDTPGAEEFLGRYGRVLSELEKQEIRHAWARMQRGDSLSILGLRSGAKPEKIRQAFWESSRKFHLDRYSGMELGEYRRILEEINMSIAKAYQELRVGRPGKPAPGSGETVRSALNRSGSQEADKESAAEALFQEAENTLRGGNVKEALSKAKLAASLEPRNNRYRELFLRLETLLHASRTEGRSGGKGGKRG